MKSRPRPKRHAVLRKCVRTADVDNRSPQKRTRSCARQEQVPNSKIAEHASPLAVQASIARHNRYPKRKPKQAIQRGNQNQIPKTCPKGEGHARARMDASEIASRSNCRQVRRLGGMRQHATQNRQSTTWGFPASVRRKRQNRTPTCALRSTSKRAARCAAVGATMTNARPCDGSRRDLRSPGIQLAPKPHTHATRPHATCTHTQKRPSRLGREGHLVSLGYTPGYVNTS